MSAYEPPFHTWASMPQLIDVERWPADDRPGSIAYFCGALQASWPPDGPPAPTWPSTGRTSAPTRSTSSSGSSRTSCRARRRDGSFRWDLLCGRDGHTGRARSTPSSASPTSIRPTATCSARREATRYRLRADESGYDNLVLAGDWTDNGLNAGCIEAATLSGLQAANAVLGRSRSHRIAGTWLG